MSVNSDAPTVGWNRRVRSVIRQSRKRLRSLPNRLRCARAAFVRNTPPGEIEIAPWGPFQIAWRKGTADEGVLLEACGGERLVRELPEYQPAADDVILDVGAHIGTFALPAAALVPRGRVYAIEACAENCAMLRINAALNKLDNIEIAHLALAGRAGTVRLFHNVSSGNWGHTITFAASNQGEDVPADTLAGFLESRRIARCQFIKFNCEGAEFPILLGSPRDVLARIDAMLVLYHCDLALAHRHEELDDHLRAAGFATTLRNQGRNRGWIVAVRSARAAVAA